MINATVKENQAELSKALNNLSTDKARVKLLLKTISHSNNNPDTDKYGEMIAFSVGYLEGLLGKYNLCDFNT